ncbi:MAG: GNAT family N-acetyltransferase [Defluviicoccus sp.]|nr:MAG: GNAT family N-acetyltransferase [Defluviicoccus sp.]
MALALVKLAQIGAEIGEIAEIDINPLLAGPDGVLVIAASVRLAPFEGAVETRLAIRPYPSELEKHVAARDGRELLLRPIRPEDEPALRTFVRELTPEDRRLRFFSHVKELDARLAARLTQIDYDREMALVLTDPSANDTAILGVMRISADPDGAHAEYAGAVRSDLKGLGLGRLLLQEICECARRRGIGEVWGEVLAENAPMLALVRKLGFSVQVSEEDRSVVIVRLPLQQIPAEL